MILHFSHIGLTDGRTFMIPFELDDPDGEALETGAVAATIPRSGLLHADGPSGQNATGKYSAVFWPSVVCDQAGFPGLWMGARPSAQAGRGLNVNTSLR